MAKIKKVSTLADLNFLAQKDERYRKLMICAAENLGGVVDGDSKKAYDILRAEALEGDEKSVVGEVNFCRDLV